MPEIEDFLAQRTPRQVASDAINAAVHDAVSTELAEARLEDDPAAWTREHQSAQHRRRHALACVDVANDLDLKLDGWIANARATGSTWQDIGDVLGSTRQGVHRRYAGADATAQHLRQTLSSERGPVPTDGWSVSTDAAPLAVGGTPTS